MKTKVLYLLTLAAVLLSAAAFSLAEREGGPMRYVQHEQAPMPEGEKPEGELVTHLPLITVDTMGVPIAYLDAMGGPLRDAKTGELIPIPEGAEEEPACTVDVVSREGVWHRPEDTPDLSCAGTIRIRGNSSRQLDKKSYLLRLKDSAGQDMNAPMMGIDAASEWVLYGPLLDRTLVRNYLVYTLAGQIMPYTPDVRYCELILNGEYQGVYLMTEAVTKDDGRVDLTEPDPGRAMTSWLVRFDRDGKGDTPLSTFTYYTYQAGVSALDLRYPGKNTVTPERIAYVREQISQIERTLYSADFRDPGAGYAAWLDTDAFAEYLIINELFGNVDAGRFSTYYYKDVRGKVTPVVWDFNNGCDNYKSYTYDETGFYLVDAPWFDRLVRDESFVETVIRKYRALRQDILSDEYMQSVIDGAVDFLGDAVERNYTVWGYIFDVSAAKNDYANYLQPRDRNYASYDEALSQLKTWLTDRGDWLDAHIETLLQYCRESKNASLIID